MKDRFYEDAVVNVPVSDLVVVGDWQTTMSKQHGTCCSVHLGLVMLVSALAFSASTFVVFACFMKRIQGIS